MQDLHRRGGHGALDAAARDRALDAALVVDVHRRADVQRRGSLDHHEQAGHDAPALAQPARHGGGGVLNRSCHP
jgi:hypothetical protein